jgi:hypothetical protein
MKTMNLTILRFALNHKFVTEEEFRLMTTYGELETTVLFTKFLESLLPEYVFFEGHIKKARDIKTVLGCTNHGMSAIYPVEGDEIELLWIGIEAIMAKVQILAKGNRITDVISVKFDQLQQDPNHTEQGQGLLDALNILFCALSMLRTIRESFANKNLLK